MTTKDVIKNTLLRLLENYSCDDLTVKMVCKEAGISRQTLYNHYYCLMDALEEAYKNDFEGTLENCDTYCNWLEGFRRFLEFLQDWRKTILHIYHSSHRNELMSIIRKYGELLVRKGIVDCATDIGIEVAEKDQEFMLRFYMNVFMGIVENYISDRMAESLEYIVSRCDAMMRYHIHSTLKNIDLLKKGEFHWSVSHTL